MNAKEMGKAAFAKGLICAPAVDPEIRNLIKGKSAKEVTALLTAWLAGWHTANLAAPVTL